MLKKINRVWTLFVVSIRGLKTISHWPVRGTNEIKSYEQTKFFVYKYKYQLERVVWGGAGQTSKQIELRPLEKLNTSFWVGPEKWVINQNLCWYFLWYLCLFVPLMWLLTHGGTVRLSYETALDGCTTCELKFIILV